jgi:hypothetical protein
MVDMQTYKKEYHQFAVEDLQKVGKTGKSFVEFITALPLYKTLI